MDENFARSAKKYTAQRNLLFYGINLNRNFILHKEIQVKTYGTVQIF